MGHKSQYSVLVDSFLDRYSKVCETMKTSPESHLLVSLLQTVTDHKGSDISTPDIKLTISGTTEQVTAFFKSCENHALTPFIISLIVCDVNVHETILIQSLCGFIRNRSCNLRVLSFSNCFVDMKAIKLIVTSLKRDILRLNLLEFISCGLNDEMLEVLGTFFSFDPSVKRLNLSNDFSSEKEIPVPIRTFCADLKSRLGRIRTITEPDWKQVPSIEGSANLNAFSFEALQSFFTQLDSNDTLESISLFALPICLQEALMLLFKAKERDLVSIGISLPHPYMPHLAHFRHQVGIEQEDLELLSEILTYDGLLVDFGVLVFTTAHKVFNPKNTSRVRQKMSISKGGALRKNRRNLKFDENAYDPTSKKSELRVSRTRRTVAYSPKNRTFNQPTLSSSLKKGNRNARPLRSPHVSPRRSPIRSPRYESEYDDSSEEESVPTVDIALSNLTVLREDESPLMRKTKPTITEMNDLQVNSIRLTEMLSEAQGRLKTLEGDIELRERKKKGISDIYEGFGKVLQDLSVEDAFLEQTRDSIVKYGETINVELEKKLEQRDQLRKSVVSLKELHEKQTEKIMELRFDIDRECGLSPVVEKKALISHSSPTQLFKDAINETDTESNTSPFKSRLESPDRLSVVKEEPLFTSPPSKLVANLAKAVMGFKRTGASRSDSIDEKKKRLQALRAQR
ncbi:hypothetical protein PCE1_001483 [Barthelona sp. PCE]